MITLGFEKQLLGAQGTITLQVNCSLKPQDLITLFGKSGAGKTTILRILAGLLEPDFGRVQVGDCVWYEREKGAKKAAQRCVLFSLLFGTCASIIFFIFADFITVHCLHNHISKNVIYLICIALPFIAMSSAINGYFTAVRRVYKNALAKFFEEFIKIACTAVLLKSFMPDGIDYACYALILADVISEVLSFICLYFLNRI